MYLLIVLLPLISALTAGFFGRYIGREGAKYITTGSIMTTCAMSYVAFYEVALMGQPVHFDLMTWIDSEMFSFSWGFLFDSLTVVMLVVVTSVSSLVHLYSTEYMGHDPHLPRFMSYLSLFTFFILIIGVGIVTVPAGLVATALSKARELEEQEYQKLSK